MVRAPANTEAPEALTLIAEALLADLDHEDALPLLAFALEELNDLRQKQEGGGDTLTLAAYRDSLGRLKGARQAHSLRMGTGTPRS